MLRQLLRQMEINSILWNCTNDVCRYDQLNTTATAFALATMSHAASCLVYCQQEVAIIYW